MNLHEAIQLFRSTADKAEHLKAETIIYNFDIESLREDIELLPSDAFLLDIDSIVFHLLYCHQGPLFFPHKEYWADLTKHVADYKAAL